jgi:hypothetical protein
MSSRKPETWAKRARELAVKEKRERKQAKKDAAAAARAADAAGAAETEAATPEPLPPAVH